MNTPSIVTDDHTILRDGIRIAGKEMTCKDRRSDDGIAAVKLATRLSLTVVLTSPCPGSMDWRLHAVIRRSSPRQGCLCDWHDDEEYIRQVLI
jgi:hypothetical protein